MNLYHFTRPEYLSSILKNGLDRGEVPLNDEEAVMGISLTEDAAASSQNWTLSNPAKLQYRLTIQLEPSERLMRWRYVPDVIRMDRAFWKSLRGDPYKWWVYFGAISPERVVAIYDAHQKKPLAPEEIEAVKALEIKRGEYMVNVRWVTFEDARIEV